MFLALYRCKVINIQFVDDKYRELAIKNTTKNFIITAEARRTKTQ
jgi:hypothetical protein